MHSYNFIEAKPLLDFIEKNKDKIIGHTLKKLHTEYWPDCGRVSLSDNDVVLELDDYCIVINYLIISDIQITVGSKEDVSQNQETAKIINYRNVIQDYYAAEFERGVKKELIEERRIEKIEIERFSESFECNASTGKTRPDGGDYFSDIRLYLDSGLMLCLCAADSTMDGYIELWCE